MFSSRLTLQNRITGLLIVASIILISIFTFIQLNNQLTNINRYNTYQANLASIIIKSNLESALRHQDPKELAYYFQSNLETLASAKIIPQAVIFDRQGSILASTDNQLIGSAVGFKDLDRLQELENLNDGSGKLFVPEIDKASRKLNIFLALSNPDKKLPYAVKISFPLSNISEALADVYKQVLFSILLIILANIFLGYMLAKTVIGPVKVLNEVTKIIAGGDLNVRTVIHTGDELEELGSTFNFMAQELVKMKERAENANPLTKLPGNLVIREMTEAKIKTQEKFMVIYCDLDNFKSFNDKYGISKGDETIKLAAEIFKSAIKEKGNPGDFLGHEGGDDFILLSTPQKAEAIADYIIREFGERIKNLYDQKDRERGYIESVARDGSIKKFPIMTISLMGVTNQHRLIASFAEITNIMAELKKKAKSIDKSIFVIDRRSS